MKMHDNRNSNPTDSFYEESPQFPATQSNNLKRPLTLDLNGAKQQVKKQRFNQSVTTPTVLSTPDIQRFCMATPELEKFIMPTNGLPTPTPGLFPSTKVTIEQENYARPFEEALIMLRNNENAQQNVNIDLPTSVVTSVTNNITVSHSTAPTTTAAILSNVGMSGGSITYTNLDDPFPVAIKDEPQTVPSSPPMSPIDMEDQERIKLERKRQRNRVAASKCRKRKLERISKLEDKVKCLKGENVDLGGVVKALKEHVCQLKQQVIDHINSGCNIPLYNVPYFKSSESDIKQ